ncbi:MAG: hypothetical protein DWQ10_06385 [Calditrichaeota bacterium]|nr:MAG: hypothetical protein DWQ10_06385 [Calditrichota bacterium]
MNGVTCFFLVIKPSNQGDLNVASRVAEILKNHHNNSYPYVKRLNVESQTSQDAGHIRRVTLDLSTFDVPPFLLSKKNHH